MQGPNCFLSTLMPNLHAKPAEPAISVQCSVFTYKGRQGSPPGGGGGGGRKVEIYRPRVMLLKLLCIEMIFAVCVMNCTLYQAISSHICIFMTNTVIGITVTHVHCTICPIKLYNFSGFGSLWTSLRQFLTLKVCWPPVAPKDYKHVSKEVRKLLTLDNNLGW